MKESFEDKIKTYKEKSPKHLQNWKKIKAIENFAKVKAGSKEAVHVKVWQYLECFIRAYSDGYILKEEEALLNRLLKKYNIDYTKWGVKDGWVKNQLYKGFKQKPQARQLEFWFDVLERERIEAREKTPFYSKLERNKLIHPRLFS